MTLYWVQEEDDLPDGADGQVMRNARGQWAPVDEWCCDLGGLHTTPGPVGWALTAFEDHHGAEYEEPVFYPFLLVRNEGEGDVRFCEDCADWLEQAFGFDLRKLQDLPVSLTPPAVPENDPLRHSPPQHHAEPPEPWGWWGDRSW